VRPTYDASQPITSHCLAANEAERAHAKRYEEIDELFRKRDEAHALSQFDVVYGSIASALEALVSCHTSTLHPSC
jgi:hypothetical protein